MPFQRRWKVAEADYDIAAGTLLKIGLADELILSPLILLLHHPNILFADGTLHFPKNTSFLFIADRKILNLQQRRFAISGYLKLKSNTVINII